MPDREKVIKRLEEVIAEAVYPDRPRKFMMSLELAEDALALLKAQEARVMTLEEVNTLDWDYCYLEQERLPGKEYRGMLGKYIMNCVTWPSITAAKISYSSENYGKTWRCWTSRPTDAQREATPWN